ARARIEQGFRSLRGERRACLGRGAQGRVQRGNRRVNRGHLRRASSPRICLQTAGPSGSESGDEPPLPAARSAAISVRGVAAALKRLIEHSLQIELPIARVAENPRRAKPIEVNPVVIAVVMSLSPPLSTSALRGRSGKHLSLLAEDSR